MITASPAIKIILCFFLYNKMKAKIIATDMKVLMRLPINMPLKKNIVKAQAAILTIMVKLLFFIYNEIKASVIPLKNSKAEKDNGNDKSLIPNTKPNINSITPTAIRITDGIKSLFNLTLTLLPHFVQNFAPSFNSFPHSEQVILILLSYVVATLLICSFYETCI